MTEAPEDVEITATSTLTPDQLSGVLQIADDATAHDGVSPLDDQVHLDLVHSVEGAVPATHLLVTRVDGTLVGYAHARSTDDGPVSAHVLVAPTWRRHGVGTALASALLEHSGSQVLRVWAHGDEAAAHLLADKLGFTRARDLWQMRRRLDLPIGPPVYPDDVHVRTFEVGQDDSAWVRVNAEAFASHPEQGQLTVEDLRQRVAEPWFDPRGFFLAVRGTELLGFHWTKVHPATPTQPDPIGEVYVVGVSPKAQGLGLGKALTTTGLLHLRSLGLREVMLYVDGDNVTAIAVYEKLGFTRHTLDVMYEHS
jgi:mycothiol synthase